MVQKHIWIAGMEFYGENSAMQPFQRSEVMKISSILRNLFVPRFGESGVCRVVWADDPYGHPDIRAMTERERADLPSTHMPARVAIGGEACCTS